MRVLHVLDHALPEVSGYSIRSHAVLCAQRAAGIDVIAVARAPRATRVGDGVIDGVPYVRFPTRRTAGPATWRSSIHRVVHMAAHLCREARRHDVALLHAHSPSLNGVAALWAGHRARLPVAYEMRALWEDAAVARRLHGESALRYRASRALETWLIRRVAALVVISRGLRDEALRRGVAPERIVCAPNGVDTQRFGPRAPDADLVRAHALAGQMVFGYLGFFSAYEGVDILLRAFAQLAPAMPRSRLALIGSGDTELALRGLAADLGVASRVIFAGAVAHDAVPRWYSVCDVLAYPRGTSKLTVTVTPLKPLEAMAMAKPIVAARVGGLEELVRDGETGVLVSPDDPATLAAALADLARQPLRRAALGANARRFVCEEREWAHLAPIYADLYGRLLPSRPGPGGGTA